ncbi:hypothetical protein FDP51_08665 [Enterococcus mundtii]|uniref:hypothetical protein n=1 Tax=Enterococcus mundtii TaxID=53346 RepID=UPI00129C9202|nr:hypothetical protein [Enterococcus mundtii]MRI74076.1 hypothetical protein [Enterococcus mundtii]
MKLKPQNTYRHLLNFMGDGSVKPVLGTFHITKEGHIEATDSHVLLRLLNRFSADNDLVIHPKELREVDATYPETTRLFPTAWQSIWLLDREEAAKMSNFLKGLKKNTTVALTVEDKKLRVESDEASANFQLFDFPTGDSNGVKLTLNSTYLKKITDFISDCSVVPTKLCVSMGAFRPLVFRVDGQFEGLIAQIRTK